MNYFLNKGLSYNLINFVLSKYTKNVFENNIDKIRSELNSKKKSEEYICNYLLRKGYEVDEIKRYVI